LVHVPAPALLAPSVVRQPAVPVSCVSAPVEAFREKIAKPAVSEAPPFE
jgi:hypothetical protein